MAGTRFSGAGMYNTIVEKEVSQTKLFRENRIKESGGRKLLYLRYPKNNAITVASFAFAQQKLRTNQ